MPIAEDSCLVQVVIKKSVRDFITAYVSEYGGTLSAFIRDSVSRDVYRLAKTENKE